MRLNEKVKVSEVLPSKFCDGGKQLVKQELADTAITKARASGTMVLL